MIKNLDYSVIVFKTISNEKRLEILCYLSEKEMTVNSLEDKLDLSQSALSQHLAKMRRDNIVETRRDAQSIYYSIKNDDVKKVIELFKLKVVSDDLES